MQDNSLDQLLEDELVGTKTLLRKIQNYKFQGQKIRAKMNWLMERGRDRIGLISHNDQSSSDPEFLKRVSHEFFHNLFTSDQGRKNQKGKEFYLKMIP